MYYRSSTRSAGLPTSVNVILTLTTTSSELIPPSRSSSTATTSVSESFVTLPLLSSAIPSPTLRTSSIISTPTLVPTSVPPTPTPVPTSVSTPTHTPVPTSILIPTPTLVPIERTLNGSTFYVTITSSVYPRPSVQLSPINTGNGFLRNKALAGIVIAVVGVVALILVVTTATIALRRRKRNRLHDEAGYSDSDFLKCRLNRDSIGKRRFSILTLDSGHSGREGEFHPTTVHVHHPHQGPYYDCNPTSESQHTMLVQSQYSCRQDDTNGFHDTAHIPRSPTQAYGSDVFLLHPPPSSHQAHPI
ncbi:hypothetical protein Ac2012v2_004059 [Leucoagaricus gongylophorus]